MSGASVSKYPSPARILPRFRLGLRSQIVLALAALMLLAFVPLFFAVASLTRATIVSAREHAARALGRAIAARVADARTRGGPRAVESVLERTVETADVVATCIFAQDGSRLACSGSPADTSAMHPEGLRLSESAVFVHGSDGLAVDVVIPEGDAAIVTRLRLSDAANRGTPLVRLVALYMVTFGLALLVFAYLVLTRLIVRPVDQLVEAADRVANGARTLHVPRRGARELIELGTSVRAMAERLIHEEAALIVKVEELTDTTKRLTQTQAQLVRSERLASVGRLAAGVAHEIGNPIAALMGMQDLLVDGQLPRETQEDFLQRMRRETQRIHAVVRDLLDFARPEEPVSHDGGPPAPADVRVVVDSVVDLLRPQKDFRTVRIDSDVDASLRVALPAPRLTQVLLNVVLNAGAAIASAHRVAGCITIRARRVDGGVRIEVADDGPGIATQIRDRLFEPFATTKGIGEGMGLGLAVCRGLVESAGGEIGVDPSYPDGARGACFYLVLPAAGP